MICLTEEQRSKPLIEVMRLLCDKLHTLDGLSAKDTSSYDDPIIMNFDEELALLYYQIEILEDASSTTYISTDMSIPK